MHLQSFRRHQTLQMRLQFQDATNKLTEWSDEWMMPFITSKCTIMHFGCENLYHQYVIYQQDWRFFSLTPYHTFRSFFLIPFIFCCTSGTHLNPLLHSVLKNKLDLNLNFEVRRDHRINPTSPYCMSHMLS